jgi:serine/threonine protein kinase
LFIHDSFFRLVYDFSRYSFGVVLWELLTGREPWAGFKPLQIMHMVAQMGKRLLIPDVLPHGQLKYRDHKLCHAIPTIPVFDPLPASGCPLELPALIHRCWAEPHQRPTFKAILEDLQVTRVTIVIMNCLSEYGLSGFTSSYGFQVNCIVAFFHCCKHPNLAGFISQD